MDRVEELVRAEKYLTDLVGKISEAKVGIARVIKRQLDLKARIAKIKAESEKPESMHEFSSPEVKKLIEESEEMMREHRQDELTVLQVERDELHQLSTSLIGLLRRGEYLLEGVQNGNLREMIAFQFVVLEVRLRDVERAAEAAKALPGIHESIKSRAKDVLLRASELVKSIDNESPDAK